MKSLSLRWKAFCALGLLVCIASAVAIFPRIPRTQFHGDESDWIAGGYYYTDLLRKGDFEWQAWACDKCGPFGKFNLHLGKLLMGIPLMMDPATRAHPYFAHYDYDASVEENLRAGTAPPTDLVARARTAPALFGVLCCLLAFSIGFWAYNAWVGLISASLMMTNSLFLMLTSQAMADSFYNFFLLACCLTLVLFCKTTNPRHASWVIAVGGVFSGLACSVKITGILIGSALFVSVVLYRHFAFNSGKRQTVWLMTVFGLCALGTVYGFNPVFWPTWSKIDVRELVHETQSFSKECLAAKRISIEHDQVAAIAQRYPQLRNLANVAEFPILFLRWNRSMQRQISHANWHGNRVLSVNRALFALGPPNQSPDSDGVTVNSASLLFAALTGAGIFFLWARRRLKIFSYADDSQLAPMLYFLVNYLLIVMFMKLNWNRYYLPTIIAADLLAAVGVYGTAKVGYAYLTSRLSQRSAERHGMTPSVNG